MRALSLLLGGAAAVVPMTSHALVEVAIIFDTGLREERTVFDVWNQSWRRLTGLPGSARAAVNALERALDASEEPVAVAVLRCRKTARMGPVKLWTERGFIPGPGGLTVELERALAARSEPCAADADLIDAAIDAVEWTPNAERRILVLGPTGTVLRSGARGIEQVMHRASLERIVVHAFELHPRSQIGWMEATHQIDRMALEVRRILGKLTQPDGHFPASARQAVMLTGGTYFHWQPPVQADGFDKIRSSSEERALARVALALDHILGPDRKVEDVLERLAKGALRPSEISKDELPEELRGFDLEMLIDLVFDAADARRVLAQAEAQLFPSAPDGAQRSLEQEVARAVLGPPRKLPSQR